MAVVSNAMSAFDDDAYDLISSRILNGLGKIVLILDPASRSDLDILSDEYKRKLGFLNEAKAAGRAQPSCALDTLPLKPPSLPKAIKDKLTGRQQDVLRLIVQGMSNKEKARALKLAEGTVKIHVAALFGKLRVHRRSAVVLAGARFLSDAQ